MVTLAAAQAGGQTGSWAALVAALPLALHHPSPAIWLAVINGAWAGPAALGCLTGRLIDRIGPRLAGTAAWLAAAACTGGCAATGRLPWAAAALAAMSACRGTAVAAGDTAPTWLPGQPATARAGSWLMIAAAVPLLAGPIGSAAILASAGPRAAWAAAAALLAAAAAGSAAVPATRPPGPPPGGPPRQPAARFRGPLGSVLAITAATWLSYGGIEVLQPLYVRSALHASLTFYAWTLSAFATGGIITALIPTTARARPARSRAVPTAALAVAAGERLFTATPWPAIALAGAVLWGAAAAAFTLASRSAILTAVHPQSHGQALSAWRSVQSAGYLSALVAGPLAAVVGLPDVLAGMCALTGVTAAGYLATAALAAARQQGGRAGVTAEARP
jgi:hypothetical protein